MSMFNNTSRLNCLGSAALFAALALMATAAFGGTVNHPDFSTAQVAFTGINESGPDIPPSLLMPPDPTVSLTGSSNELSFFPNRFVKTDQSLNFQIKSLSSKLGMFVSGKIVSGTAGPIGYELDTLNLNIKGAYDLYAPFVNIPPSGTTSLAQVQMSNVPLTIKVTQVNWDPKGYAGGDALGATMNVTPNTVTAVGPNGAASGIWSGSYAVDMNALRSAAGILPTDFITQIQITATPTVYAASTYASATASVTNLDVQTNVEAVAIPEPPTVILAGLGVAAAVGQGYRRRKSQRNAQAGAEMVSDETGAIALTA